MTDSKLMHEAINFFPDEPDPEFLEWFTQLCYHKIKAKGKAEGITEGEAKLLTRLLEKRFGEIPPTLRERILTAEVATLETWCDRVLQAPDLQSVFAAD